MRKNLFDYATKELSQDAFLRWFFENYEDEQIGPIVVEFINYFSKGQSNGRKPFDLKYKDIKNLRAYSQVNCIDVSVDLWSDKFDDHRTIVIEDKTDSEEHNQLETYNDAIKKWNYGSKHPEECVYKIFYKTHSIEECEIKRVTKANWTPFGIEEIYSFFIKYLNTTNSDVLNDYINHIKSIYGCYKTVSGKPAKEWNSINWETFFNKLMESYRGVEHNFTTYHGFYDSMLIYFNILKNECLTYVVFEIQIRSKLKPYLHPGFHIGDKWEWSASAFEGKEQYEKCTEELNELRSFVESFNSPIIKRANTARAFAKIKSDIELNCYKEDLIVELDKWVSELERIINSYNSGKELFISSNSKALH